MKLASPRLFLQPHANSLILILGKRYSFFFEGPLYFHDGRKIPLNNPLRHSHAEANARRRDDHSEKTM
jgi:hypothetical protein